MRSADIATVIRVVLVVAAAYLILYHLNGYILILLLALIFYLDNLDGYLAIRELDGSITPYKYYIKALNDKELKNKIYKIKEKVAERYKYGGRIDIAGDRFVEYTLFILFTYLHILPLFVFLIVILRNSFTDALLASKGTSSKMKTKIAKILFKSNLSRLLSGLLKFILFAYLILVYEYNYNIIVGYVLVAAFLIFFLIRGLAEIIEALKQ
ncbi:MAG: hypothetical protein ARM1_0079 [Candidatus Micrarchaeota archaeon]|nr:MAG: hypothetical protein ARM1_0079 [Candidatus Micrarchaeota archaeon]